MNKIRTILILVVLVGGVCTVRVWAGAGGQQTQNQQQAQNQQQPPQQQTTPPPRQQNQSVFPGPQQQSGGIGSRVQGRGSAVILRRRYNPRRGRVEIVKHGIISQTGFLNLQNTSLQNRRKALRNYRSR